MRPTWVPPQPGQESVWDYPRPPRVEASDQRVRVVHAGRVVADSRSALRVLESWSSITAPMATAQVATKMAVPA